MITLMIHYFLTHFCSLIKKFIIPIQAQLLHQQYYGKSSYVGGKFPVESYHSVQCKMYLPWDMAKMQDHTFL
jgi:hypothetical protein